MDLPKRTEEKFTRWRVQSEEGDIENAAFFHSADTIDLVARLGHVIYVDRLLEVIVDLNDTSERDGSETEIVANICNNANVLVSGRSTGWQITAAGATYWNAMCI